jgi:hypothetical protein
VSGLDPASIVAISGVAAGGAGGGQAAETTPVFDVRINYVFDRSRGFRQTRQRFAIERLGQPTECVVHRTFRHLALNADCFVVPIIAENEAASTRGPVLHESLGILFYSAHIALRQGHLNVRQAFKGYPLAVGPPYLVDAQRVRLLKIHNVDTRE